MVQMMITLFFFHQLHLYLVLFCPGIYETFSEYQLLRKNSVYLIIKGRHTIFQHLRALFNHKKSLATNCSLQNPTSKRFVRYILERHFSIQLCKDTRYIRFFHYAKILKIDEVYVSKICTNVSSTIQEKIMNTIKLQKRLSKL